MRRVNKILQMKKFLFSSIFVVVLFLTATKGWAIPPILEIPPIPEIPSFPTITSNGNTYHVDKDIGSNSYTAAQAQNSNTPWSTIEHGVDQLSAGDILIVHEAGTPYIVNTAAQHDVTVIGTQTNWVTIKGADGERPVISTDYTSSCVSNCPRGFRLMPSARYIYITNFDMLGFIYIGIKIETGAEHIVIDDIDMYDIDAIGVDIGDIDTIGAKHLYLRDITVTNSGYCDNNKRGAFMIAPRSEDIVFEKCNAVNSNSSGFRVYGWTGAISIPYNDDDAVKDLYLINCEVYSNNSTQANFAKVYNLFVKNCVFANGMDYGDFSGLKFWGKELWLINSVIYNNHLGLELPPVYEDADIYLLHNTFVDNKWSSVSVLGYRYVAPGVGNFYSDANMYLYNNIFNAIPNIYYAEPRCCFLANHTNGKIIESNNNFFFGLNNERLFDFYQWVSEPYNKVLLRSFRLSDVNDFGTGDWQTDITYGPLNSDINSISRYPLLDPGFTNMAGNDYSLLTGCLAIDAGCDVGVTEDIDGIQRPQGVGYDIGAYEYCGIIGIYGKIEQQNITIYPNPTTGIISISGKKIELIEIFNIEGQIILQIKGYNEKNNIDLIACPKGIYLIKIVTDKGMLIEKIVLE